MCYTKWAATKHKLYKNNTSLSTHNSNSSCTPKCLLSRRGVTWCGYKFNSRYFHMKQRLSSGALFVADTSHVFTRFKRKGNSVRKLHTLDSVLLRWFALRWLSFVAGYEYILQEQFVITARVTTVTFRRFYRREPCTYYRLSLEEAAAAVYLRYLGVKCRGRDSNPGRSARGSEVDYSSCSTISPPATTFVTPPVVL